MPTVVKKWGNSAAVRIPAPILEAAHIALNQAVEVRVEAGRIVIEAVQDRYDLDALIANITPENRHQETDVGVPVGRER